MSMGLALTSLVSNSIGGSAARVDTQVPESPTETLAPKVVREDAKNLMNSIVERLVYQTQNEQHVLLLRKPSTGAVYADHSSHGSHGSHSSHSSGN